MDRAGNREAMLDEVDRIYDGVKEYHAFLLRERDPDGDRHPQRVPQDARVRPVAVLAGTASAIPMTASVQTGRPTAPSQPSPT